MADYSGTYYLVNGYRSDAGKWAMPSTPVYRLYNQTVATPYHYLTTDHGEYVRLGGTWTKEGVAFWTSAGASVPVYRLYNRWTYMHMYTTDRSEYDRLAASGWTGEGRAFDADSGGDWPVYRVYNKWSGEHLLTASTSERDRCVAAGWTDEGTAFWCYGLPALDACVDMWQGDPYARTGLFGYRDSQLFRLTASGTGYALASAYSNLYVGASGTDVRELRGAATDSSRWTVTELSTAAVDGQSAKVVRLTNVSTGKALALAGDAVGSTATLEAAGDSPDQRWALVPWRLLRSGGLYELRLVANTGLALDVNQALPVDGTNVMVHPANGGNNQKFYMHDNGDGWSLRDISSGKMVDVTGGALSPGANVQIHSDNSTRAQRWRATQHGTARVGGTECAVVTLGAANGTSCLMAAEANAYDANVLLADGVATSHSSWALVPTWATDGHVPVPSEPRLSAAPGRHEGGDRAYQERCYPSWTCADAWMVGKNSYQLQWCARYLPLWSTEWGAWGATHTATSGFASDGNLTWYAPGVDTSYDQTRYKGCQVWLRVRVQGAGGAERIVGGWSSATHGSYTVPSLALKPEAGWSFDGLRVGYDSSYTGGVTYVYVTGLRDESGNVLFSGLVAGDSGYRDSDGSIVVPWPQIAGFNRIVGHTLTVEYQVGNDAVRRWTWRTWTGTVRVSENAGTTDIGTVSTRIGAGRTLVITARTLGNSRCDVTTGGGDPLECRGPHANGDGTVDFVAEPTFCPDGIEVNYMTCSADGDSWAVRSASVGPLDMRPCHAFDWDGSDGTRQHVLLEVCEGGPLSESHRLDPDHEDVALQGRREHSVTYAGSRKHSMTVRGAFVGYETETGGGMDAEAAINGLEGKGHVHYRSPSGWDYDVAITSASYEVADSCTTVSVSITEETV
ncbi:MAG: RICIN domain-containing protein [Coriobacteriaceae bacterium]|nr:RICIN domain-containing protein [Coriobacteriaceae bacterium]